MAYLIALSIFITFNAKQLCMFVFEPLIIFTNCFYRDLKKKTASYPYAFKPDYIYQLKCKCASLGIMGLESWLDRRPPYGSQELSPTALRAEPGEGFSPGVPPVPLSRLSGWRREPRRPSGLPAGFMAILH